MRRVMLVVVLLVLAAIAWGGFMFFKRPLAVDAWISRLALRRAGLEKQQIEGPAGTLTVWVGGSGPTLVLLHGAGDQAGAWGRVVSGLAGDHRLVVPDLPGHGGSAPEEGPLGIDVILGGVGAVMDARCTDERPVLIGNSLGAWVALVYAADHPDRVSRVVAVNGGAIRAEGATVNLYPRDREEARETMNALMGPATAPMPGFVLDDVVRRAHTGPLARIAAGAATMGNYLLEGQLDRVTVPVELVWGDADQLMTMDYARRMLEGLPDARLHVVHGCGHVPQRECPLRFLEVLRPALEGRSPEGDVPAEPAPATGEMEEAAT